MGQAFSQDNPHRNRNIGLTVFGLLVVAIVVIVLSLHFTENLSKKSNPNRFTNIQVQLSEHAETDNLIVSNSTVTLTYNSLKAFPGDVQWVLYHDATATQENLGGPQPTNKLKYKFPVTAYESRVEFEVTDPTDMFQSFKSSKQYLVEPLLDQTGGVAFSHGQTILTGSNVSVTFNAEGFSENPISKATWQIILSKEEDFKGQTFPQLTSLEVKDNVFTVSWTVTDNNMMGNFYWKLTSTDAMTLGLDHELVRTSPTFFEIVNEECTSGFLCMVKILDTSGASKKQFGLNEAVSLAVTVSKDFPEGKFPTFAFRTSVDGMFTSISSLVPQRNNTLITASYVLPSIVTNNFQIQCQYESNTVKSDFVRIVAPVSFYNFDFSATQPLGLRDSRYFTPEFDPIVNTPITSGPGDTTSVLIGGIDNTTVESVSIGFSIDSNTIPTQFKTMSIIVRTSTRIDFELYMNAQDLGLFQPNAATGSSNRQYLWVQYKITGDSSINLVTIRPILIKVVDWTPQHSAITFFYGGKPISTQTKTYALMEPTKTNCGYFGHCQGNTPTQNQGTSVKTSASTFFFVGSYLPYEQQNSSLPAPNTEIYVFPDNWGPSVLSDLKNISFDTKTNSMQMGSTTEKFWAYSSSLDAHAGLPAGAYKDYMYVISNTTNNQYCHEPYYPLFSGFVGCDPSTCSAVTGNIAWWGVYPLDGTGCVLGPPSVSNPDEQGTHGFVCPAYYDVPIVQT